MVVKKGCLVIQFNKVLKYIQENLNKIDMRPKILVIISWVNDYNNVNEIKGYNLTRYKDREEDVHGLAWFVITLKLFAIVFF